MKSWPLDIIGVLLVWLALAAVACGDWVDVPCVRQQQGSGILAEIQARLPAGLPQESTIHSTGHYGAHYLNSHIRNKLSPYGSFSTGNAAYFYGGRALILPIPPVRLSEVFRLVPAAYGPWGQTVSDWDHNALYVLDECSAYLASLAAQIESGRQEQMQLDLRNASIGCDCVSALARLSRQRGWRHAGELDVFVVWCRAYLEQLRGMIR